MTTGKTTALTRQTFVGKVMPLFFNMLSRLASFSSMEQASFNFMAAVTICSDFGAPQNKVSRCFYCFPIYLPWSDGTGCHDLCFLNVDVCHIKWVFLLDFRGFLHLALLCFSTSHHRYPLLDQSLLSRRTVNCRCSYPPPAGSAWMSSLPLAHLTLLPSCPDLATI